MKNSTLIRRDAVIDSGLRRLCQAHPGRALTCREISEGLGGAITVQGIHFIEQKALRKLWRKLHKQPEFEHLSRP